MHRTTLGTTALDQHRHEKSCANSALNSPQFGTVFALQLVHCCFSIQNMCFSRHTSLTLIYFPTSHTFFMPWPAIRKVETIENLLMIRRALSCSKASTSETFQIHFYFDFIRGFIPACCRGGGLNSCLAQWLYKRFHGWKNYLDISYLIFAIFPCFNLFLT